MANEPTPRSYESILGDMIATYLSKIGVNDLNTGSAVLSFFEAMAQAIYRSSGDTLSIFRDFSVDRAEGEALKKIAAEERITIDKARVSTGKVNIADTSFNKISTKIYAASNPPNIGSTTIKVADAGAFPTTGSIYIGRGTQNIEGPIDYSSITAVGSYYEINLDSPTTKFHNVSELVVLSQGGTRNIPAGTVVKTKASGASTEVSFTTTKQATILDGENLIENVEVAAQEPGSIGNVPRAAIRAFESVPFTGAVVSNPDPIITGRDAESDESIRAKIKRARISRGLGTELAVRNAVQGAQASDENAIIVSSQIISDGETTTLYIDNGEGYEEKTSGVGLEYMVDSALGGETNFQLAVGGSQTSVAKAFLESSLESPFSISSGDKLAILVGGILSEHTFIFGDFRSEGFATAYEIVASINSNSNLLYTARTIDNGTRVVVDAISESDEYLEITEPTFGNNASIALGFTSSEIQTLRLYKNRIPLSRNGRTAKLESEAQSDWQATIESGDTLIIKVDNTQYITYTFEDSDFLAEGSHPTVAKSNSLSSWVNVMNTKFIGLTASINGNTIVITSNLGANSRASVEIDPTSTLVTKGMFSSLIELSSDGKEADFVFSRNTAQIKLNNPLESGDNLTAGTEYTNGFVKSSSILGGNLSVPSDAHMWIVVDDADVEKINHGVSSGSFVHISQPSGNIFRFRSDLENAFINVQVGDYVILWSEDINSSNRIEGRVYSTGTLSKNNDYFEVKLTTAEYTTLAPESPVIFTEGLTFIRTDKTPQKLKIPVGSYNINTVSSLLNDQLIGAYSSVEDDELLNITTKTKDTYGSIYIAAIDEGAKNLNFTENTLGQSIISHFSFYESANDQKTFPLFAHSSFTSDKSADTPDTNISTVDSALDIDVLGIDPNALMVFKNPYLTNGSYIEDMQAINENVLLNDFSGTSIEISESELVRRIRIDDRYYLSNPYDFGHNDSITVIFDNDVTNKTFTVPLYREATTNTQIPVDTNNFNAFDNQSGATTEFTEFFGNDFSFQNYKVLMQAKNVIDPSGSVAEDAILYRAAQWGRSGEKINVGYTYPTAANLDITHTVLLKENVEIRIGLKSGNIIPNQIDGTTEWDITVTPDTPVVGVEEVTYTWNSTGTNPDMTTLLPGHFVTIGSNGEFNSANTGTFRISSATSTSFTVRRENGSAVAETGVATLTTGTISLYENSDTTATEIIEYVENNLTNWIIASIIDDNGDTGVGVIAYSTHEDTSFVNQGIQLVDGINWLYSSDLDAAVPNPKFVLKRDLTLPSYNTLTVEAYAFNDGEVLRFVPVTAKQIEKLADILAVSGINTVGKLDVANRCSTIQLGTEILGSEGSVQVSGGNANSVSAAVIGSAAVIEGTDLLKVNTNISSGNSLHSDQWVKLVATNTQKKVTGISLLTGVTIESGTPELTQSTITLSNKENADRYFGQPHTYIRDRGRAFHVEKHGSLVCVAWDGQTGSSPMFSKSIELNDDGGDISVAINTNNGYTEYTVASGDRNFSEVNIGDYLTITGFTNTENNGTFKINGISEDKLTISTVNTSGITETATIAIGDISVSAEIKEGDIVDIGDPFTPLNQGRFRVIRRYEQSIYIDNPSATEERVEVSANLIDLGFDATSEWDVSISGNAKITWNGNGTQPDLSNVELGQIIKIGTSFSANNQGEFMITSYGDDYIEFANPKATAEAGITVASVGGDVLEVHKSAIVVNDYENTLNADYFVISGDVLGDNNQGRYLVSAKKDTKTIITDNLLTDQTNVILTDKFTQVYVEEENPYVGYKQIDYIQVDPANENRASIILKSSFQNNKINSAGSIAISSVNTMNFPTVIKKGLDSYRYHTGLIAEANKIVYGEPRDSITYPGVSAAGSEIFIKPPLFKRIVISINVRVQTNTPFNKIVEQVRNNVAALINSNPIGNSIAISDIVATANLIPGVKAISISSPAYNVSNDMILVNPAEKTLIIDIINDIVISKVG